MKPVAIIQQVACDGPAYFADHLRAQGLPMQLFRMHEGAPLPADLSGFSGLALLGGPMSANDPLPHLRHCERLVRIAVSNGQPVIGHCLGGQLMARALGASVQASASAEIGWQTVACCHPQAQDWFGVADRFTPFQWHGESFALPAGALRLAGNAHCPNQAFSLGGIHLAMQFHIEVDAAKIDDWLGEAGRAEIDLHRDQPGVQPADHIAHTTAVALPASQAVADLLYRAWCRNLAR